MKHISKLKIAIVHDVLDEIGGSEQVVLALTRTFPQADIFTTWKRVSAITKNLYPHIISTWKVPYILRRYKSYLKPIINLYWETLDFSNYEIVISSSHSFSSKNIITPPHIKHICYCHTPPKYLYMEASEKRHSRFLLGLKQLVLSHMRMYDFIAAQRPDFFIAGSQTVKARIKKYYGREAEVVYPPVAVPKIPPTQHRQDYYLSVGRLTKQKKIDLAIKACNTSGDTLIIIGEGDERSYLEKIAGPTIKFLGFVDENTKIHYLRHARAFLFPAVDEDFGMAPVEAMAHGTPVIAYWGGGVRETVVEGKTGLFFHSHSVDALLQTMVEFNIRHFNPIVCYKQAQKFSEEKFSRQIRNIVLKQYNNGQNIFI